MNKKKTVYAIITCIFVFVTVLICYGIREPKVSFNGQEIVIDSIYHTTIKKNDIKKVTLEYTDPEVLKKTNGFNFGNVLKGHFLLSDNCVSDLYIVKGKQPYIYINQGNYKTIINYKNSNKTEQLYKDIVNFMK